MFPAYKPSDIAALPTHYYLKLRDYYLHVQEQTQAAIKEAGGESDVPELRVVNWDQEMAKGKAV